MTEDMQKENDVVLLRNWINRAQAEYATRCQLAYLLRDLLDAETVGERDIVLARIKNHPDIKFRKMAGSGEPTVEPDYRSVDCAKCGRMRVEKSGICEKCKWNNDVGEYVSDSVLCGATISMHERDSTNDKPCVLEEGHPGDCAPRLPESVHDPAGVECSVKMSRPNLYVGGRKICTAEKSNPVPESVMPQGRWPDNCQQRAFVEGMKWWQFHHNGSTVFGSERDEAEKEAIRRYGIPPDPSMICSKNTDGYHDWEPNTPLRDNSVCTACGVHANDCISGLEPAAEVEVAECSRCRRPIYNMSGYYRHTHDDTTVCGYANDWPYIQPYVEEAAPEAAGPIKDSAVDFMRNLREGKIKPATGDAVHLQCDKCRQPIVKVGSSNTATGYLHKSGFNLPLTVQMGCFNKPEPAMDFDKALTALNAGYAVYGTVGEPAAVENFEEWWTSRKTCLRSASAAELIHYEALAREAWDAARAR